MRIFLAIFLTMVITWIYSTQFNIDWPRILTVNLFPGSQTFNATPNSFPITEPPQPTAPSPKILPKDLPRIVPDVIDPIAQLEREVVRLVNEVRAERGIGVLQWDDRLHNLARVHSLDMANRGKMFHSSPDALHGENCFYGAGLSWEATDIVEAWLKSKEHRTWLLCPNLENIAVGINAQSGNIYASWAFWINETKWTDWWYMDGDNEPPDWWY